MAVSRGCSRNALFTLLMPALCFGGHLRTRASCPSSGRWVRHTCSDRQPRRPTADAIVQRSRAEHDRSAATDQKQSAARERKRGSSDGLQVAPSSQATPDSKTEAPQSLHEVATHAPQSEAAVAGAQARRTAGTSTASSNGADAVTERASGSRGPTQRRTNFDLVQEVLGPVRFPAGTNMYFSEQRQVRVTARASQACKAWRHVVHSHASVRMHGSHESGKPSDCGKLRRTRSVCATTMLSGSLRLFNGPFAPSSLAQHTTSGRYSPCRRLT